MQYLYSVVEEQLYHPEIGSYRSFGIQYERYDKTGRKQLAVISDISTNKRFVVSLAERLNVYQLFPIHLRVYIDDILAAI